MDTEDYKIKESRIIGSLYDIDKEVEKELNKGEEADKKKLMKLRLKQLNQGLNLQAIGYQYQI